MPTNQVFAACLNVLNIGCVQLRECRWRRHMYLFLMFAVGKNRCSRTDFEWEPCKMCVASALPQTNLWCCTRGHYLGTKMISSPPKLATTVLRCNAYLGPYERRGLDRRTRCAPTLVPLVILMQLLVGVPSHRKIEHYEHSVRSFFCLTFGTFGSFRTWNMNMSGPAGYLPTWQMIQDKYPSMAPRSDACRFPLGGVARFARHKAIKLP